MWGLMEWAWYVLHILSLSIYLSPSDVATLSLGFTIMHGTLVITPLVMFVYTACVCMCVLGAISAVLFFFHFFQCIVPSSWF
jgi:hypothetical protein